MKFIITENKIGNVVFSFLNNKNFIIIDTEESILFTNSEDDKYGQIAYMKDSGSCFINNEIIRELNKFFPIDTEEFVKIIGNWVEDKLNVNVGISINGPFFIHYLTLPNK